MNLIIVQLYSHIYLIFLSHFFLVFLLFPSFHVRVSFSFFFLFRHFLLFLLILTEAFLSPPGPIGIELTWNERLRSISITLAVILFNYFTFQYFQNLFLIQLKLSINILILSIIGLISVITAGLYIYNVYIVNLAGSTSNTRKTKLNDKNDNDKIKKN